MRRDKERPGPGETGPGPGQPRRTRTGAASTIPRPADMRVTWSTPDLRTLTPRALDIWTEANQLGYRRGYEDGYRAATADHWQLPSYGEAVANIIAVGSLGIDRRERARREAGR